MRKISKMVFIAILLSFSFVVIFPGASDIAFSAEKNSQATVGEASKENKFIIYYFYTSYRCFSCKRIEQWSHNAIQKNFSQQIKNGALEYQAINTDKPENTHFIKDFKLYTKSLVIVEQKNGKAVRSENLEKVWHHLRNKENFYKYVTTQIKTFIGKS